LLRELAEKATSQLFQYYHKISGIYHFDFTQPVAHYFQFLIKKIKDNFSFEDIL